MFFRFFKLHVESLDLLQKLQKKEHTRLLSTNNLKTLFVGVLRHYNSHPARNIFEAQTAFIRFMALLSVSYIITFFFLLFKIKGIKHFSITQSISQDKCVVCTVCSTLVYCIQSCIKCKSFDYCSIFVEGVKKSLVVVQFATAQVKSRKSGGQ